MEWISVDERLPKKEGYYQCICASFPNPIRCKFRRSVNGPVGWCAPAFIYKKRIPFVFYWRKKQ